jgi:hypothetical protein
MPSLSASSFARALVVLLGAAAVHALVPGCSSDTRSGDGDSSSGSGTTEADLENVCDLFCGCRGCSDTERSDCISEGQDVVDDADDAGCSPELGGYVACVEAEFQCLDNGTIDVDGCNTEIEDLEDCMNESGTTTTTTSTGSGIPSDLCDQAIGHLESCGLNTGEPPPDCSGEDVQCVANCVLDADCDELTNPQGTPYVDCINGCGV